MAGGRLIIETMPHAGKHPMSALAWCACSEFGDRENPRPLLAVLGHRRHRKTPECEQPPYLLADDGAPVRADYPIKSAEEQAAARAEKAAARKAAAAAPPIAPPMWSATPTEPPAGVVQQIPDIPLGGPPTLTGKATMPAPDPKAGLLTPAPLFSLTIRVDAGVAQLWDWTLQQGYTETFETWVSQTIKAAYRDLIGIAPMIVPVEAAAVA